MDKNRQILRVLIGKSLFCLAIAVLGWLVCSRLVHLSDTASLSLALILLVLLDVKLFLSYSEVVRRRLLNLQNLEDDPLVKKYAVSLKTHFIVLFVGQAVIAVILFLVIPRIETIQSRYVAAGLFSMSILFYIPILQLISYRRLSHAAEAVVPTPLNFLAMLWPTWTLSTVGSVVAFAGICAVLVGKSALYLLLGSITAIIFFITTRSALKNLLSKVASLTPAA